MSAMGKRDAFTKILAWVGSLLVWFPVLAPFLFGFAPMFRLERFRFDYLMPAELFLFALAGGGLLLWSATRARLERKLIGWGLGIAMGVLVLGLVIAVGSGLAAGYREPVGLWWMLVLLSLAVYSLAVVAMGIGGVNLLRGLYPPRES